MSYHDSSRHPRKPKQDPIEVKIVVGIFKGMWWLIALPFRGLGGPAASKTSGSRRAGTLDTQQVSQQWSEIQTKIGLGGSSHFASAIVAADRLLDHVLRQKGYTGDTMGERLKNARDDMSSFAYQNAWQAHKLRNQLVHEMGIEIMSYQAKEAIGQYESALRDLGGLR